MRKIQRALISVHDKTGILPLAKALLKAGVEIISTGGTARFLRESASRKYADDQSQTNQRRQA